MTRAADALGMAQSAASAAVAGLEGRHGAKLFHRVGRGIELTEAGRSFLGEARALLARAEAAEQVLSELGGLRRGRLLVAASQTVGGYWLPRHLVAFRRAYPGVELALRVGNTAQVAAAVMDGTAELGFVEGEVQAPSLSVAAVARDRMVVVVGAEHPWAGQALTAETMMAGEWVLREPGSGTRSVFERALAADGVDPGGLRVAMVLPSNEAVRAAVEAGLGATAISASVAAASLEAGLLCLVRYTLPDRTYAAVRHVEREASRAAAALLALIAGRSRQGGAGVS